MIRLQLELESANEAFDSPEKVGPEVTNLLFQVDRETNKFMALNHRIERATPKGFPSVLDMVLQDRNGNTVGSFTFTHTEEAE